MSDGTKDDTNTKSSFSSLWLGESIVQIRKELNKVKENNKIILEKDSNLKNEIMMEFNKHKLSCDFPKIDNLCKGKTINIDDNSDFLDLINTYKSTVELNKTISSEEEFLKRLKILRNNNIAKMLLDDIKKDELLKELYLSDENREQSFFETSINEYNQYLEELSIILKAFKSQDKALEEEWLTNALKLHENLESCLFCGNENITEIKTKWKNILESNCRNKRNNILSVLDKHLKSIENILVHENDYNSVSKEIIESVNNLKKEILKVKEYIENLKLIDFKLNYYRVSSGVLLSEINAITEECHDYVLGKFISKYEIIYHIKTFLNEKIAKIDSKLIQEMNKHADSISKDINDNLIKLGLEKELEVKIEKRGNDRKYSFNFKDKNNKIGTLSDGQKHKLALAIFLSNIKNKNVKDKIIVLDDPVVTLDQRTYYAVRTEIMELTKLNPKSIILLTHNISYLHIQLSNLFNTELLEENVTLYHLYGDSIVEIDPNVLNYDDLTLYKKAIKEIKNIEEFSILATINIRMYRYFLDHHLRILGIPSTGNPSDEIKLLNLEDIDKMKLNSLNVYIENRCKDTNAINSDLYETFVKLNEFVKMLGYPLFINDEELIRLQSFSNNQKREKNYSGDNILFNILLWVHHATLYDSEKYRDIKRYICHPRHQLTSSIVGVDFTNSELDDFI